jgi:bifunctional NMN adenylyltransferase/nudix hydrolase
MKLAVVIGRFQPYHLGHHDLITKASKENDTVLLIIGSTNVLPNYKNPFTKEERKWLIIKHLEASNLTNVVIRFQADKDYDDDWVQDINGHVLSLEEDPTQVVIYCNPKDEEYYRENFVYPVETVNTTNISATRVRELWYDEGAQDILSISELTRDFLNNHADYERLTHEYDTTEFNKTRKTNGHPFGNPVEPVSFAVIIKDGGILVGRRTNPRGYGQLGLPGGFVNADESTLDTSIRETQEELGVDLRQLIKEGKAVCMAQSVEENLDDLGARTIGINYLFVIRPDTEVTPVKGDETSEFQWLPIADVCEDRTMLFYNHNRIVRHLLSKVGGSKDV